METRHGRVAAQQEVPDFIVWLRLWAGPWAGFRLRIILIPLGVFLRLFPRIEMVGVYNPVGLLHSGLHSFPFPIIHEI